MAEVDERAEYQRIPIEEMSHRDAAETLLGQSVRYERDRANRNRDGFSVEIKMQSAMIHALLAIEERLECIAEVAEGS